MSAATTPVQPASSTTSHATTLIPPPRSSAAATAVKAVAFDTMALTSEGWRDAVDLRPGDRLLGPDGQTSEVVTVAPVTRTPMIAMRLYDGSTLIGSPNLRLHVLHGEGGRPDIVPLKSTAKKPLGRTLHVPRLPALPYGGEAALPLSPRLLGWLLGDGYFRHHSVEWCNEADEMRPLLEAELPAAAKLGPMIVGQAGTGQSTILGDRPGNNDVLNALRELDLTGKRAWEKSVPDLYLHSTRDDRLALLQGLLDTDGSIDKIGRIEFSSSSKELARAVRHLVYSLGGRCGYTIKTGVTFTSPRQQTKKAARDSYRLTNVRLPEDLAPFTRPSKAERVTVGRAATFWKVTSLETVGSLPGVIVTLSGENGTWIAEGGFAVVGPAHEQP